MLDLVYKLFKPKYHWYQVTLIYMDKRGTALFTQRHQVGFRKQKTTLNSRDVKKTITPLHLQKNYSVSVKHLLCNGSLVAEIVCYLGRF